MVMSRTARILVAILLLAAAAFFWVNFYSQNRTAETPVGNGVADTGASPAGPSDGAVDAGAPEASAAGAETPAEGAAGADASDAAAPADPAITPEAAPAAEDQAAEPVAEDAPVAAPEVAPPTVVVDAPVAVGREIVISDLPFLVTEPRPTDAGGVPDETVVGGETQNRSVTAARVTVNPFSPVVVQAPPAPAREVPAVAATPAPASVAPPAVASVAVPAAPVRAEAPTPRAVAPVGTPASATLRPLPTGAVLSSTPDLLRQPRVAPAAATLDLVSVAAIVVPEAEAAQLAEADPRSLVPPLTPVAPSMLRPVPTEVAGPVAADPVDPEPSVASDPISVPPLVTAVLPDAAPLDLPSRPNPEQASPADAMPPLGLAPVPDPQVTAEQSDAPDAAPAEEPISVPPLVTAVLPDAAPLDLPSRPNPEQASPADAMPPLGLAPVPDPQVTTEQSDAPDAAPAEERIPQESGLPEPSEPVAEASDVAGSSMEPGLASPAQAGSTPLAAGVDPLSRYLRDNNYTFTGSVVGPVGVGVFRSAVDPAAVVVALGQTLPGTDIVLTDLRGQQAELTLGDDTHILTLDLRR